VRGFVPILSERRRLVVPAELDGRPLDRVVKTLLDLSWGDARQLVGRGKVKLGAEVVTDGEHPVRAGENLAVDPNAKVQRGRVALDRTALVHVDPHIVVVDKPSGISTVPFDPKERGTLDQLLATMLRRRGAKGPPSTLGVVQRLDKETSGLLVFARTLGAKKVLAHQLRRRTVHRRYLGIAHGIVPPKTLRSYLVKDRGDRLRGTAPRDREGQLAVTHVEPLEALLGATLVACRLETGRTHQIRIQLAEAGHPLLGERVYVRDYEGDLLPAPRVMLHAAELGFVHPVHGTPMKFEVKPPSDFTEVLLRLRRAARRDP
jgi:23S rRNA pseudouridine1911/1915/1917 synthase